MIHVSRAQVSPESYETLIAYSMSHHVSISSCVRIQKLTNTNFIAKHHVVSYMLDSNYSERQRDEQDPKIDTINIHQKRENMDNNINLPTKRWWNDFNEYNIPPIFHASGWRRKDIVNLIKNFLLRNLNCRTSRMKCHGNFTVYQLYKQQFRSFLFMCFYHALQQSLFCLN